MPAERDIERIVIRIDKDTGVTIDVEVQAFCVTTEQGLVVEATKVYQKNYVDMGVAARARFDSIKADADAFMQTTEPIA